MGIRERENETDTAAITFVLLTESLGPGVNRAKTFAFVPDISKDVIRRRRNSGGRSATAD
jgi:hypothetical protein